jgi:hypothetical protein
MLGDYYLDVFLRDYAGFSQAADMSSIHQEASSDKGALKSGAFLLLDESRYNLDNKKMVLINDSMQILGSASSNEIELTL